MLIASMSVLRNFPHSFTKCVEKSGIFVLNPFPGKEEVLEAFGLSSKVDNPVTKFSKTRRKIESGSNTNSHLFSIVSLVKGNANSKTFDWNLI